MRRRRSEFGALTVALERAQGKHPGSVTMVYWQKASPDGLIAQNALRVPASNF